MPSQDVLVCPSYGWTKALVQGDSYAPSWGLSTTALVTPTQPSADGDAPLGVDGMFSPALLLLAPYGIGGPGLNFSLRVWSWRKTLNLAPVQWIAHLLIEVLCTTSNVSGQTGYAVDDRTFLCDNIVLTAGSPGVPGQSGEIVVAGPDLPAFARIDTRGATIAQIDFQQVDNVGMNCFLSPG